MVRISKCKNENNCPKSESCYRVHAEIEDANYMKFHNLCSEKNDYLWYWEMKRDVVVKEEIDTK